MDTGLVLARSLQHPLTLAFFQSVACTAMHIAGDSNGCSDFAEQLTHVAARYDLRVMGVVGSFMLGAARALQGDFVPALKQMEPLFEVTFGYGFFGMHPGIIMAQTLTDANCNRKR